MNVENLTMIDEEYVLRERDEWIKRLLSGETKKRKGSLHKSDDSMCCLGVYCDLKLNKADNNYIGKNMSFDDIKYGYDKVVIPSFYVDLLGLYNECGTVKFGTNGHSLVTLNDEVFSTDENHVRIGEILKENYDSYFKPVGNVVQEFNRKYVRA